MTTPAQGHGFTPHALRVDGGFGDIYKCLYKQLTALTTDKVISGVRFDVQA